MQKQAGFASASTGLNMTLTVLAASLLPSLACSRPARSPEPRLPQLPERSLPMTPTYTMTAIDPAATVGQLAAERPARGRVFEQFGIDYCCGGKTSLRDASARAGADLQQVIDALLKSDAAAPPSDEPDFAHAPLADLIANILNTHHAFLRRELPRLTQLAAKVHQVHAANHPELAEVQGIYADLRAELESHMLKEEHILFPLIQSLEAGDATAAGHCGSVQNPIRVMEYEHDSAGAALERLRTLTGGYTPPADACNAYRALLTGLSELEADLHQHIHKENNIVFPRAVELEATLCATEAPHHRG